MVNRQPYHQDFFAWANEQAGLLRKGRLSEVLGAARETGKDRSMVPIVCPWSFEQITDPNFYPEATN
jgi:hypothetical protein